jgi:hypothetical protein
MGLTREEAIASLDVIERELDRLTLLVKHFRMDLTGADELV